MGAERPLGTKPSLSLSPLLYWFSLEGLSVASKAVQRRTQGNNF